MDFMMILQMLLLLVSVIGGLIGGAFTIRTYRKNSKLKRAEWLYSLYEKFYEQEQYKKIRRIIDYKTEEIEKIEEAIKKCYDEPEKELLEDEIKLLEDLCDYLNFFEFIGSLLKMRQISLKEVKMSFEYYITLIGDHEFLLEYITDGFENLDALLSQIDDYIFIYGTLRKKIGNKNHKILAQHAKFVGEGTFKGKLYDVGEYPGAVSSRETTDVVKGEVYAFHKREHVRRLLDEYEGCGPNEAVPTKFIRKKVTIALKKGKKIDAWIYIYNQPVKGLKLIPSGDYLRYHNPKK